MGESTAPSSVRSNIPHTETYKGNAPSKGGAGGGRSPVRVPAKPHRSAHIRGLNRALRTEEGKASDEQGALLAEVGNRHAMEDARALRSAYGYPY